MNANMLMAEIKLKGFRMKEFLLAIQMPRATWSKKIRGITEFSRAELNAIINALSLNDEKVMDIFLNNKVA